MSKHRTAWAGYAVVYFLLELAIIPGLVATLYYDYKAAKAHGEAARIFSEASDSPTPERKLAGQVLSADMYEALGERRVARDIRALESLLSGEQSFARHRLLTETQELAHSYQRTSRIMGFVAGLLWVACLCNGMFTLNAIYCAFVGTKRKPTWFSSAWKPWL